VNTPTVISTLVFGFVVVVLIGLVIRRMLRGWRHRAERQEELIGALPSMPDQVGAASIAPTRGLYLGSTLAGSGALRASGSSANWLDRVNVGDLGYRCKAVLTRYPEGILLERSGAGPLWMPAESVTGLRTERAMAGKVLPTRSPPGTADSAGGGILVIRWTLPSGTVLDTGFRGDDRSQYARWISQAGQTPSPRDNQTGDVA
jgi:hypothetical protein